MKKEKLKLNLDQIYKFIFRNKKWLLVILIFALEVFLRFSQIDTKNPFGWDQVDNAWAAKNIIINHRYPLTGMIAKQNSGFYIGPLYYYFVAFFYWITNLHPVASGLIAGFTSIFTFWALFYVLYKLFSFQTAVIGVFIETVAYHEIIFDRVQWPVDFVPALSILILYFMYKTLNGEIKFLPVVAVLTGLMFHLHFTAIFFIPIIMVTLPFFPRTKQTLVYIAVSFMLFIIFFIPSIASEMQQKNSQTSHLGNYISLYFIGFHLKRVFQIAGDAFIQFIPFLFYPYLALLEFMLFPLFIFAYTVKNISRNTIVLEYLFALWFLVPWLIFSTYNGEISDYYFAINRFVALAIIAYLLSYIYSYRYIFLKFVIIVLLCVYGYFNIQAFSHYEDTGLKKRTENAQKVINQGGIMQFQEGVPETYFFYYYMRLAHKHVSYE